MATPVTLYRCDKCEYVHGTEEEANECCRLPQLLAKPDIDSLRNFAMGVMEEIAEKGYSKDVEAYSYQELMQAFYGPDIFERWINEHFTDG